MSGRFKDGIANSVVAMNSFVLGCTSDCVIAIDVRVFATSGARVRGGVDWETETVLQRDSKTLGENGKTEGRIGDDIEKGTCLW